MALTRDACNTRSLGPSLFAAVKEARVLMVGAGGIGCELLKNLALTGYHEIHVVDLDTIDLSNLNRQFLFRHEHIKKSKALVATEVAKKFNPNVKIVAHHANIKDSTFNVEWFRGFKIVFNALDNLDARRHVNRLCLAADVPLIESGTTGFNGQVQVIKKGVTACYDCTAKETPKSFPVCTIRSTPSQPIHCIVWGKSYLLNEIFGTSEDQGALDVTEDADNAAEIAELKKEAEALRKIRDSVGKPEFPQMLFDKVFNSDIERLRSMDDMWKSRSPPTALKYEDLLVKSSDAIANKTAVLEDGQKIWSLEENLAVFNDSLDRLSKRMLELKKAHETASKSPEPTISFDKDDQDTLEFVAASANIRSHIFGIDKKSCFDIKQMAGNIIPAIATTNAIVAGLCVLESFKVMKGEYDKAGEVFLSPFNNQRLLAPDRPRPPNPDCPICSPFQTSIYVDLSKATLKDLVEDFIQVQLGFGDREFAVNTEAGLVYDPDETDNLEKRLSDLSIKQDSFITVVDDSDDDTFVNIVLNVLEAKEPLGDKTIKGILEGAPEIPRKPKKESAPEAGATNGTNGEKCAADADATSNDLKRARTDDGEAPQAKKAKTGAAPSEGDDVVVVDEGANGGAIVIDDD
ncbi:ubiquitin-activating enzyme-like protein [Microdochium trichocladiopsis]|uniref:Ubiquitin-activating enzyme E1-like n=1 Tax=Microdochium trichocladiopsis TaxID=1682393 RepID=A0A9P8YHD6_9PEZI|nr:ubiquitin-activating enzyme-like protein [Microdochium trichocladiopsis]KAH7039978.1 ubiquitin-activating enzyme-like protein [Microdochium trichocladiopsis]